MQASPLSYIKIQDYQSRETKLQTPVIESLFTFTGLWKETLVQISQEKRWNHKILFCKNILKIQAEF